MEELSLLIIAFVPFLPLVFVATSFILLKVSPGKITAFTQLVFGLTWLSALIVFGIVLFKGSLNYSLLTVDFNSSRVHVFGFLADRLSTVMLLLVITVSGIVHLYSIRSMQEERHFKRYFTLLTLVTLEVLLVVLANNLLMLGIFWILKGITLTFLLAHYQDRTASWQAAFTKLKVDIVGDTAFLIALFLVWKVFGTFDIATINNVARQSPQNLPGDQLTLLTVMFLIAAMAKSAQFPLHRWLPGSVEAPTPVSALMHAGLINAGGFLFIRLSALFTATPFTMGLAIVVGAFTAFYGTLVMLTRNDVKGMLVYSTMGQMGFMILECGLGAFGLAILHLVAHGLFKATLFLNSGNVIQQKSRNLLIAPVKAHSYERFSALRFISASLLAAFLLFTLPGAFGFSINTAAILLVFVWFTIVYAVPEVTQLSSIILFPGIAGLVTLYLLVIHTIEEFFAPVIAPAPALNLQLLLIICGALILPGMGLIVVRQSGKAPVWAQRFIRNLYVRTMLTGYGK
ncbi:MAG TPA: proton-conducting transporter membrane subunit [Chloroflexia bacterium]|nr:proton-conducting transporter membrane subunit [Chloroflexia bacterium]